MLVATGQQEVVIRTSLQLWMTLQYWNGLTPEERIKITVKIVCGQCGMKLPLVQESILIEGEFRCRSCFEKFIRQYRIPLGLTNGTNGGDKPLLVRHKHPLVQNLLIWTGHPLISNLL